MNKLKNSIVGLLLLVSLQTLGQGKLELNPEMLKMGWQFASPLIIKQIPDPLAKEMLLRAMPKIIDKDVKGASYEIANAVSTVKKVKVLNKLFLAEIEKSVNLGIKAIQKKDYASVANNLLGLATLTDYYLKTGKLEQENAQVIANNEIKKESIVKNEVVNSKLHMDKNNNYLFFLTNGTISETSDTSFTEASVAGEDFKINLEDSKAYHLAIITATDENFKQVDIDAFKTENTKREEFKGLISILMEQALGSGKIIKSEYADNYNVKGLKYTYTFTSKKDASPEIANAIVTFNNNKMYIILFSTVMENFPTAKKAFDEMMSFFYIIGADEMAASGSNLKPCEKNKTGFLVVTNTSNNPYDIYVNEKFKIRVAGKGKTEPFEIPENNNLKLYTRQVDGYMLYPTEKTSFIQVESCKNYTWTVPF
jgi:hypothetical protein